MTKEQLAEKLNGSPMGHKIDPDARNHADDAGLVVVFGYSDDCVELRGAIHDEISAYEGITFRVTAEGILPTWANGEEKTMEDAEEFFRMKALPGADIKAVWNTYPLGDYSWTFETSIPHATFDIIEEEENFCRGIVFSLGDLLK